MSVIMDTIDILKKFFEGKDWYITFFTLITWVLLFVLIAYTVCQFILLIFKVKYKNEEFINEVNKVGKRENQ